MRTAFAFITAIATLAANAIAADSMSPSFDCDMAGTEIEKRIRGSPELAALDRAVARRYDALGEEVRSEALRNGLVADQRAWLGERNACGEAAGPTERETCLRDAYQRRRLQLDFYRFVFVGPPFPYPLKIGWDQAAASQVDISGCLTERSTYVARALKVAAEAALAEMRELERITSADIGAEKAFLTSQKAYEADRDATCAAVAASYAGASGSGIAQLSCQMEMDWDRVQRIASRFLFRPPHWSETLHTLAAPIQACLKAVEKKGADPRITGIMETDDGGQLIRIAAGDAWRGECAATPDWTVTGVTEVDGMDVWPGEGQALFWPKGSRIGIARLREPPYDPCSLYRWVATRRGDFSGWIQLTLCW